MRATSGIDASTPTTAASRRPSVSDRVPTLNRYDAMPRAAPGLLAELVRLLLALDHLLDDPVPGPDHRRAERHEVGVGHAPVIHRDREEAGRSERDRVGRQLFQVAADRLLALVDAEDRLKPRLAGRRSRVRTCSATASAVCV